MHEFKYRHNALYCEHVKVSDVAAVVGTPFYLYSYQTIVDHYQKINKAFTGVDHLICFSMKSNSNLAICRILIKEGSGLDIVSGGELFKALKIGIDPKRIVFAGVGKSRKEIEEAIRADILFFNVESLPEIDLIDSVAKGLNVKADVCLRLNPDVAVKTHRYIVTGMSESKFGMSFDVARRILERADAFTNIRIRGLHVHIGSQITRSRPYVRALKRVYAFVRNSPIELEYLNIGGGLGVIYNKEQPQTAHRFARAILPFVKKIGLKLILEPGRFIVGNSGILVTRVAYLKESFHKKFVIVDAGMNDLVRPSYYNAYHSVVPVERNAQRNAPSVIADVVGPICESGDFLAKSRHLPILGDGDLLAVMGAGAYGYTMSSNYNSRPRVPEVLVMKDKFYVVRERETYKDLIKGEIIPEGIL